MTPETDHESMGRSMHRLAAELYPICRSMTGAGVRETLDILRNRIPVETCEVPTGEPAFDWEVPREWSIRDAYIRDGAGHRVVDFRQSNLHVVNGSIPVRTRMTWAELRPRLFSLPERPDWIPYRTSFFQESWGFCLPHRLLEELERREYEGPQTYDVCIDAELADGSLTYGELVLPGRTADEIVISTHICHPSLANDNLSGIAVATFLAERLQGLDRRHTLRFLFLPATIGPIVWLSRNEDRVGQIRHGLILAGLGDRGKLSYRRSRRGDAEIDRVAEHVLAASLDEYRIQDFQPFGYDQRQFCSPGFNLPFGCLMRTPDGEYPEYHTSADNLDLICAESLSDSLDTCLEMIQILEQNGRYRNTQPKCEPRLGRHGLYHAFGQQAGGAALQRAVQWVLNYADGHHTLFEIAERSQTPFARIRQAADALMECGLLEDDETPPKMPPPVLSQDPLTGALTSV